MAADKPHDSDDPHENYEARLRELRSSEMFAAVKVKLEQLRFAVCHSADELKAFDWAVSLGGRYTRPHETLPLFVREVQIQGSTVEEQLCFFLRFQVPDPDEPNLSPDDLAAVAFADVIADRIAALCPVS